VIDVLFGAALALVVLVAGIGLAPAGIAALLMLLACAGSAAVRRLRARRRSAPHRW
jgi:hypothetical protein